jgi:DNA mismatch repair protein MutL
MAEIRLLAPEVAERIAAGEVIDRPAAVVKELVENAIDAGAHEVRIEARGGGLRLIRVSDDGCGIEADQAELAFRRHATSKLRDLAGLEAVTTLGFRGEALASIAAVAEVTLVSATSDDAGVRLIFRAGRPLERVAAARSRGTTVTVVDLFSQLPARLKFMRGARAEAAAIGTVVRRLALARPELRFTLVLEGHVQFRHDGGGLPDALASVFGDEFGRATVPVEPVEAEGVRIGGALGDRGVTRGNRAQLALFVNGRFVRARPLLDAIEDGYRRALPRGRHAVGAIFLQVPPPDLDVNIHPAKLDVRLRHEAAVCAALTRSVRLAFGRHPASPSATRPLALDGAQPRFRGLSRVVEERAGWPEKPEADAQRASPMRIIGRAENTLLVVESDAGLLLVDQHRAHERVIYEKLSGPAQSQALIEPVLLELPTNETARFADRLEALRDLGVICDEFGSGRFVVRALPSTPDIGPLGEGLLEALREAAADAADWRDRLLATIACRAAIRKGAPITDEQARDLLQRLTSLEAPALCPHGSPVMLQLSRAFLARQFDWR